jgi:hypothetical protein
MLIINLKLNRSRIYFPKGGRIFPELLGLRLQIFVNIVQPTKSARPNSSFNYLTTERIMLIKTVIFIF